MQVVVQLVLARLVAPEAFGMLAVLLVITNVADSIAQSGFGMALIQKSDVDDASYDTAFWLSMGIAVVMYAVLFLAAPSLALFYGMSDLADALRVLALVVIFNSANSIQRSYMQRRMDFKGLFHITLAASIASGAVGIGAALTGGGVWALVAQTLSLSVFICAVMVVVVPWRPHLRFCKAEARELFGYGWKVCVTGILNVFYTGVSELILGKACGAVKLGYYSQGRKYPYAAIGIATNAISNVLFPAFSSIQGDRKRLHAQMRKGLEAGTFIIAPLSMLCAVAAEPLVGILLGEAWLPCAPVFALACASNLVTMMQLVNLRAYMALGYSGVYLKLQIIKVIVGVTCIGGVAFFTRDIYAAAWATFLSTVFNIVIVDAGPAAKICGYARLRQLCDVLPTLLLSVLCVLPVAAISFLELNYAVQLLLEAVVYMLLYVAGALLMRLPALNEAAGLLKRFVGR